MSLQQDYEKAVAERQRLHKIYMKDRSQENSKLCIAAKKEEIRLRTMILQPRVDYYKSRY